MLFHIGRRNHSLDGLSQHPTLGDTAAFASQKRPRFIVTHCCHNTKSVAILVFAAVVSLIDGKIPCGDRIFLSNRTGICRNDQ
jgi:hypothetical protein